MNLSCFTTGTAIRGCVTIAVTAILSLTLGKNHVYVEGQAAELNNNHVSSKLQIHIPQKLFKPDGYDHREALFGIPPYGGSIAQSMYYADSDLCDTKVETSKGYPIRPVTNGVMEPWPTPFVLMVDRGVCSFVQKARNAQKSGAAGVIIADNTCLCAFGDSCQSEPGIACEPREPIMADDGSGLDVSIPSFLVFKQDADVMKATLTANRPIQIEMKWSLPAPDERVEYQLWTTPTDFVSRDFLSSFRDAAVALGKRAYFTPHMYLYDGVKSGCDVNGEDMCYNLCTNAGRYCATDPDNNLDKGISGGDVVAESLRRICVWNVYGAENGIGREWWDYVNEFMVRCDNDTYFANESCILDAFKHSGVDASKVEKCMKESGGLTEDQPNILLDNEIAAKSTMGVVILPAVFVNSAALRGALEFSTVFDAVCAGFLKGTEPDTCLKCLPCPEDQECVSTGICPSQLTSDPSSVSKTAFGGSLLFICIIFLITGVIVFSYQQRQMKVQVRGLVAQYMPLDEETDHAESAVDGEIM